jgi:peptidoglycan/LPS O-acetylase OafA/YrhL
MSLNTSSRIFGLDLLRALAILFVVLGHSSILVPSYLKLPIQHIVFDGVAIFFVLSGFLIGGILFKSIDKEPFHLKNLFTFWIRRWLRTLPIYLIILTLVIILTFNLKPQRLPTDWYRYYIFTQNFFREIPPFFGESWSLSIEEWFYLLIPSLFYITLKIFTKNKEKTILYTLLITLTCIVSYRFYLFYNLEIKTFIQSNNLITRQVVPRLDAILIGVLGAYLSNYKKNIWNSNKTAFAFFGVFMLFILKLTSDRNVNYYSIVFLPILKSFSVLFLLPYLASFKETKCKKSGKIVTFISLISYSMYLINRTIVIDFCIKYGIHDNLLYKHTLKETWFIEYLLFWGITIGLSYILYMFIEIPFMKLRDIKLKKNELKK